MGFIADAIGAGQKRDAANQMAGLYDKQANTQRMFDDMAAASTTSAGVAAAGAAGVRATQTIGAQEVGYSSGGVDTGVGTPLETMADTRMMSALDQATIRNNAAKQAWGLKVKGLTDYQQGELGALGGANKANADTDQLLGSSLSGGFSVAKDFIKAGG